MPKRVRDPEILADPQAWFAAGKGRSGQHRGGRLHCLLKGGVWKYTNPADYTGKVSSLITAAYSFAAANGKMIHWRRGEGSAVYIMLSEPTEEEIRNKKALRRFYKVGEFAVNDSSGEENESQSTQSDQPSESDQQPAASPDPIHTTRIDPVLRF